MAKCARQGQIFTFMKVNIHHSNGISEKMKMSLSELSRAMVINERKIWPITTYAILWPYVLKMATYTIT